MAMKISDQGIALIKSFEGCRLTAYKAVSTEKYYTIGWGHYGADVKAGQTISQDEADALLFSDIQRFVRYTNAQIKLFTPSQEQFDALVSFCYNCGPGTLGKLLANRAPSQVAEHITDAAYTRSGGKVLPGLVRRRQMEKDLFCRDFQGEKSMEIMVGSARSDENGRVSGGAAGDQKQASGGGNDTKGEVSIQPMYSHAKGWMVIRPKDISHAGLIASKMLVACNNANIGYDQIERLGVIRNGTASSVRTECDCSSLVRACVKEATGTDPGNFTTATEMAALARTGLFEESFAYISQEKTPVYNGDILVTKTKGHTVIVVSGSPRLGQSGPGQAAQTGKTDHAQKDHTTDSMAPPDPGVIYTVSIADAQTREMAAAVASAYHGCQVHHVSALDAGGIELWIASVADTWTRAQAEEAQRQLTGIGITGAIHQVQILG